MAGSLEGQKHPHNTEEDCAHEGKILLGASAENGRNPENPPAKTAKTPSKNRRTPENVLAKTVKTDGTPTKGAKKPSKKKLTLEEEVTHYAELAEEFPEYVHAAERAREVLEWVAGIPEVALDIETYGRLKRDGLLYTRCRVRLLLLHHDGTSFFLDCDRVSDELVVEILSTLKDKPKYLHNALFDIPRIYRRFGVLLDENVHDTLIASRVARASGRGKRAGSPRSPTLWTTSSPARSGSRSRRTPASSGEAC